MSNVQTFDQAILDFSQEIEIRATPEDVFEGMVHRLTEGHQGAPDAPPLPLELERRPGGRWYRNLGDNTGHLWGFVQSYKPPALLELFGPMFMSYPVSGHLIVRFEGLSEGTRLAFHYRAFGLLQEDHKTGIAKGFASMLEDVQQRAEA